MTTEVEQWDPSEAELVWLRDIMSPIGESEEQKLRRMLSNQTTRRFGVFKKPVPALGPVEALLVVQDFRKQVNTVLGFALAADVQVRIHEAENEMVALLAALQADPENSEVFRRIVRLGAAMVVTVNEIRCSFVSTIPKSLEA